MIKVNISAVSGQKVSAMLPRALEAHNALRNKTGRGGDFLGWVDLPAKADEAELARIKAAALKIKTDSQVLLVCGIGGSYLGARAVIEALRGSFYNIKKKDTPDIFFVGNNLSSGYMAEILSLVEHKDFSINVISKSGTTTEPAVAFRILKNLIEHRYGKEGAKKRVYATTDISKGALRQMAGAEGYETFVIPDDVGGRYSVLTPVGLLPIAAAGIDIDALLAGAREGMELCAEPGEGNPAWRYAIARNVLLSEGKRTEIMASYNPSFVFLAEWYKQLYGESEGKEGKGIFPAAVNFTADLHSMGQYIQEGARDIFETVLLVSRPDANIKVPEDADDLDGLNFLAGKPLADIEREAFRGTYLAHSDGHVPNLVIEIDKADERNLGALLYFYEYACGISGYLLGVNPFDQPGVESYKKNMFALLGKPGYEEQGKALAARLDF
jgi:glucose-6-phosphate isomerase